MKVEVTQKHIDAGQKCNISMCPISLAMNEQHPKEGKTWCTYPRFRKNMPSLSLKDGRPGCYLCDEGDPWFDVNDNHVAAFIDAFDDGIPVSPFSFDTCERKDV